ncbi:sigma-54 interaction domain-containing protein [Lentibacillus daqui]|uniref:sigma-54 interaction domain-containing protein n=1 Tax=Lentibacillus daqui TaxID=2911514 RepID=UPI0022B09060|nr:sigma 54-interacting transcriptional regulator [Lentibacillus daqui]
MTFLHTELKQIMNENIVIINEKDVTPAEIKKIMMVKMPAKPVVFVCYNGAYLINVSSQEDQLHYLACGEIAINEPMQDVIKKLQFNQNLIVKNEQGIIVGLLGAQDLAKYLLSAFQYLQAFSSTILHTIDESCTVIDQDQRVLYWTKGAEKIFSVKQGDIIGKPITEFFNPDRLELLNSLKTGTSLHHSQHHAREDLVVLINSNPVYLNGEIVGAVVSETDITSQIHLHNELSNTSEKLFSLEQEVKKIRPTDDPFQYIKGNSTKLKQTIKHTRKAASTNANILIYGESGVGKELFAKAVHTLREDKNASFVAINCGAIPAALFESEIFGYEKGAFSGANQKGKKGKIELAKDGTLFLDEIGEMPLEMQVKLLRLLQERKFYRVGGTKEIEVDFRIVAATNRDLKELVQAGKFREDLYYRLNVVSLEIPPLRIRPEDIIELTHYFLYEVSIKYHRPIHGMSQALMQALLQHDWPGNIRELKNVVERLVVFSEDGEMKLEDLPFETENIELSQADHSYTPHSNDTRSLSERLQAVEKEIITHELKKADGNKLQCAKNLQVTRATLYNRIKKLNINM